eukprot:20509_1
MLSEAMNVVLSSTWPFYQTFYLIFAPERAFKQPLKVNEYTFQSWGFKEFMAMNLGHFLYILISYLSYTYTFPDLSSSIHWLYWIPVIIIRDLVFTVITYEPWHILTNKVYQKKLSSRKFNDVMPDEAQWSHDRFWSLSGTVIAALHELLMIYFWANGYFAYYSDFWAFPIYSLFWTFFCGWWRHFHFYFVHRMIHPWFKRQSRYKAFDVGHVLYDYCHALHHQSYNPGTWSGLSMHPVEHLFYYSCVWIPSLIIPQHPVHFMVNKFHATISPAPGHDGYDTPVGGGGGGYFHYLHHAHYDCNYGTDLVPLDWLFGTFADGSKFRKKK